MRATVAGDVDSRRGLCEDDLRRDSKYLDVVDSTGRHNLHTGLRISHQDSD